MTAEEIASLIRDPTKGSKDFTVVDVRRNDHAVRASTTFTVNGDQRISLGRSCPREFSMPCPIFL